MFSRRKLVPACAGLCLLAIFTFPFSKDTLASQNHSHHMDAQPAAIRAEDSTQRSYTDEIRAWRIEARWEAYDVPKRIKVASVIPGYVEDYSVPGVAVFSVAAREHRLEPVAEPGARQLFFIFGDKTNGRETYGSGRFLYTEFAKDGSVLLDFNKAINPPCAFTAYATCPLPPKSNQLDVRIEAGEKKPRGH